MLLRYLIGRYRMIWGWCPRCNSDAPAVDTCPVCRFDGHWRDRTSEAVWRRFAYRRYQ